VSHGSGERRIGSSGTDVPADTLGQPWGGRNLPVQPFAGDPGLADPALVAALAAAAEGTGGVRDVIHALAAARVMIALAAAVGEGHPIADHVRGDLGAEAVLVSIIGPDGRRALPIFSSVETTNLWDPKARQVPVESARAALSAVAEGCDLMVLDPSGPVRFDVPRAAMWALAQGREWTPPAEDAELASALQAAVHPLPDVLGLRLEPLADTGVRIVLGVRSGLDRPALESVVHAARALIAEVELLTDRADAVELKVLPA
jgi:hypothetical protein